MAVKSGQADRTTRAAVRGGVLLTVLGLLLALVGCGTPAQTLKPYIPAQGINLEVGDPYDLQKVVHVRNLLIISKAPGSGIVSATLSSLARDQLTGVTGVPIKPDGSNGAPFTGTITNSVTLGNNVLVVLTDGTPITVTSADLAPGLSATLTLTFSSAGSVTAQVPVMDGNAPEYATISPAPVSTPKA